MTQIESLQTSNDTLEKQLTEMYAVSRGLFLLGAVLGFLMGFVTADMII